jgi:hypothetical protein
LNFHTERANFCDGKKEQKKIGGNSGRKKNLRRGEKA